MSEFVPGASPHSFALPSFIVGVTGRMTIDPAAIEALQAAIRRVFRWLTDDPDHPGDAAPVEELGRPLGLRKTPIVVLSSLAPGADQMVASEALARGWKVRAPLPFPAPLYRDCSTFVHDADDAARQQDFDTLLAKVGPGNAFHVLRPEDAALDQAELAHLLEKDKDDKVRHNLRYRSAGEYIATYCDLLIAICPQEHRDDVPTPREGLPPEAQSGTEFIIKVRLQGLTEGMLPMQSPLTWADSGPLIRIDPRVPDAAETAPMSPLAVWHPDDSKPSGPGHALERDWHKSEMERLREVARKLEELNGRISELGPIDPQEVMRQMLPDSVSASVSKPSREKTVAPDPPREPADKLERLAVLRRALATINREFDAKVKRLMLWLFVLFYAAFAFLQFYEYWHREEAAAHGEPRYAAAGFIGLALLLFAVTWLLRFHHRRRGADDWQNDTRALSEALRVQFYWSAAGISESVAAHYLQRSRNELSWIRGAVSSVAFPHEEDTATFDALSDEGQKQRLGGILRGWVESQQKYFRTHVREFLERKHRLHFWANASLVAGLCLMVAHCPCEPLCCEEHLESAASSVSKNFVQWVTGLAAAIWLLAQIFKRTAWWKRAKEGADGKSVVARVEERLHHLITHWVTPWIAGIALGLLALWLITGCSFGPACFPSRANMILLWRNLLFAMGGVLHSWIIAKFFEENIQRYAAMRDLFRNAALRLERSMQRLESQPGDKTVRRQTIKQMQRLLVGLGSEALSENADWLLMHRSHPVEPLHPGG